MREACEALGAVAYIDLPERESRAGAEKAAVEFRDAVRAAVRMKPAERPLLNPLRILVVDDNADAAHTLTALLRTAGHEVQKAASGAEALRVGAQLKPVARFFRCIAFRSKNSAWLIRAETVAGW